MKRSVTLLLAMFLFGSAVSAQVVYSDPVTAANPSGSNPFMSPSGTTGLVLDPNVTTTGIGRGAGLNASTATNRFSASGFTTTATLDAADYYEFSLTPINGYRIEFSNFSFNYQRSNATGSPATYSLRSSLDGFASDIATGALTGASATTTPTIISLTAAGFQNITAAITFRFYAYAAGASTGTFSINDFSFNGSVNNNPLPLNLLSFSGRAQQNTLMLEWTTACETGMMPFEIQKSSGNEAFTTIGAIEAKNNGCSERGVYQFADEAFGSGTQLYRLKMADFGGRVTYSNTLRYNGKTAIAAGVSIMPNPAHDYLHVSGLAVGAEYIVTDAAGNVVLKGKASGITESVPVQDLQSGLYFMQLAGSPAMKFVKQ